jgi:hypothetical protein
MTVPELCRETCGYLDRSCSCTKQQFAVRCSLGMSRATATVYGRGTEHNVSAITSLVGCVALLWSLEHNISCAGNAAAAAQLPLRCSGMQLQLG